MEILTVFLIIQAAVATTHLNYIPIQDAFNLLNISNIFEIKSKSNDNFLFPIGQIPKEAPNFNKNKFKTNIANTSTEYIKIPKNKIEEFTNNINELIKFLAKDNKSKRFKRLTNSTGSFKPSNSNNSISKLANEINNLKKSIEILKNSPNIGSDDTMRLQSLESSLETLQKQLDDQNKKNNQQSQEMLGILDKFTNTINSFNKDLDDIKRKMEENERLAKEKLLPDECIKDIEAYRFKKAEQKLQLIKDNMEINRIVRKVYNYQSANFELLMKFAESIGDIKRKFLIYKALSREMELNGHNDKLKVKKVINSLEKDVMNQKNYMSNNEKKDMYLIMGNLISQLSEVDYNPMLSKAVRNLEIVKSFVNNHESRGRSVTSVKDDSGDTLLHKAAMVGQLDIVKYLINDKYITVNVKCIVGWTPLHYAALKGHLNVVKYLVDVKRADINARCMFGNTPLHLAAKNGHLDIVKYFVDQKHFNVNNRKGAEKTPLMYATQNGHSDVTNYLRSKGARSR